MSALTLQGNSANMTSTDQANMSLDKLKGGNLFHEALQRPDWAPALHRKYKKYTMTYLLNKLKFTDTTKNSTITWSEMGRTRRNQEIDTGVALVGGGTSATIPIVETDQYFIEKDVIYLPGDRLAYVTAVALGPQVLTVEPLDNANVFVLADFGAAGDKVGHMFNLQEECYTIPKGREFKPDVYTNDIAKLHRNKSYCDDAIDDPLWITARNGKNYWYFEEQFIQTEEMMKDEELVVLRGERPTTALSTGAKGAKGVMTFVKEAGTRASFTTDVDEVDIIDMMTQMGVNADVDQWFALCGSKFLADATVALKDYHLGGAQNYGYFKGGPNEIGLNFKQYNFNGKVATFFEYPVFNDETIFPAPASGLNHQNAALFLALGRDKQGQKSIEIVYRQSRHGRKYKMFYTCSLGHMDSEAFGGSGKNIRSNEEACMKEDYSTKVTVRLRGANNHGWMYAA